MTSSAPSVRVRPLAFVLALCLAVSLAACGTTGVTIPNPLIHGAAVPANLQRVDDVNLAQRYAVANDVFRHEARLVSLDARNICFDVTVRVDEDDAYLSNLTEWRFALQGPIGLERVHPTFGEQRDRERHEVAGLLPRNTETAAAAARARVRGAIGVLTTGGPVCFDHHGLIDRDTETLSLVMTDPVNYQHAFVWAWNLAR